MTNKEIANILKTLELQNKKMAHDLSVRHDEITHLESAVEEWGRKVFLEAWITA